MDFNSAKKLLHNTPFIQDSYAEILFGFIKEKKIENILELGFAHGTSACYMAAALDELKKGQILAIDNTSAKKRKPSIFKLMQKTGFEKYIKPIFANSTYNWELMKLIEENTTNGVCNPIFDFCYIDGAHSFEVDGLAFYLVEKLLKPNGWLLFDDYNWTYNTSPSLKRTRFVKKMAEDEKNTPHIKKVFELLVKQHPNYHNFKVNEHWAWAQKKG